MTKDEILSTLYYKCIGTHKTLHEYEKHFGRRSLETEKARSVWCELDNLFQEITGDEIDYTKYE